MKKTHSRLGLLGSLAIHSAIFAGIWGIYQLPKKISAEEINSISIEMLTARLEQPEVAVAPEVEELVEEIEEIAELEPPPLEPVPEPVSEPASIPVIKAEPKPLPKPEKPKVKPEPKVVKQEKPKPKEKPKEKPKMLKAEKPLKALEKGIETKQGVVAKAVPNAVQAVKAQTGVATAPNGNGNIASNANPSNATKSGSGNEVSAYMAQLQRALQKQANHSYPQRERMMRKEGTVTLNLSVSSSGQIINVNITKSSGNNNLDSAAVKAARSVKIAPPPANIAQIISVPVNFSITR